MLEPDYFQDKCDRMIEIFGELEDYILKDIAQRLLKSGMSGTADRLIWKLEQMGEHRSTILAKLSKLTKMSKQELRDLLQEAVLTSWKDDISTFNKLGIVPSDPLKNKAVMSVMNAEYIKSMGELENLTRTTIDRSQQDLIRMLDEAEIRVASGVQSYSSAICDILDNYAAGGVKISYPTGTERTLESAVRMAVVTSMNQTSAQVTNQYIVEGNIEYVLVSAHLGARPQKKGQPYLAGHENWQGRVYRIRGSEEGFPNLVEKTGYDITEDGVGRVVNPLGLHGYNCRHSHKPWDKDLRNPYLDKDGNLKIDKEESRKLYELQQKQRAMERAIRKTKRELLVKQQELKGIAETDIKEMLQPQYDKLAYKLREQNKAYNDFCNQNNLQTQQDRLKVAGFKRAQASAANGRATVYQNSMKSSDMTPNMLAGEMNRREFVPQAQYESVASELNEKLNEECIRESKWNRKINVDEMLMTNAGRSEWDYSISLSKKACKGTIIHELLHTRSSSYYDKITFADFAYSEEAAVQMFTEEICKKNDYAYSASYTEHVNTLRTLGTYFDEYDNNYDFAKDFFNVKMELRIGWLVQKIDKMDLPPHLRESAEKCIDKLSGGFNV